MHRRQRRALVASALVALLAWPLSAPARAEVADASAIPFGPQSFWRTSLANAPIGSDSQAMVDSLVSTVTDRYGGVAAFNAHQFNSPLYTVDAATPTIDLAYDDCQGKGHTPSGLLGPGGQFTGVPVPAGAVPATGSDAELSVYSSATDQLWEFWKARKRADGTWSACWGGRIDAVSTGAGHFSGTFGATASGLPNAGGLVRLAEIRSGRITHAMSLAIPAPAIWSSFRWPAQRSDGSDPHPALLPEGSRLRLDSGIDVARLGLTPAGLTIARAAQQYGFIVVDKSGAVSVLAEAVPAGGGSPDPWRQVLGTPDYAVLKGFPWSRLQVVADGWRGPGGTTAPAAPVAAVPAAPAIAAPVVGQVADAAAAAAPSPASPSPSLTAASQRETAAAASASSAAPASASGGTGGSPVGGERAGSTATGIGGEVAERGKTKQQARATKKKAAAREAAAKKKASATAKKKASSKKKNAATKKEAARKKAEAEKAAAKNR